MFATQVYKWNSVDVLNGENGLFPTRGIVVDKAQTGLLVDFGIAVKKRELIPFDRIIQDDEPTDPRRCACADEDSVKVLLRLSPDQPWTWYPAEKLAGSGGGFVLVKAYISDGHTVTDVVRKAHVRCCAKENTTVLVNDYLKEHVDFPHDDLVATCGFRKSWAGKEALARTYPIGIADNKFYYVQRRYHKSLDPVCVVVHIEETMKKTTNIRGHKRSHEDIDDTPLPQIPVKTEMAISDLPYNVLYVVLSHLDTVESIRYRRACCLWNLIITSMDFTKVVICDMSHHGEDDTFVLAAVLLKVVKKTTTHLVFTRRDMWYGLQMGMRDWFEISMQTTKTILGLNGISVPTLVLADLKMDKSDLLRKSHNRKAMAGQCMNGSTTVLSEGLSCIFRRLVLIRVRLLNLFKDGRRCLLSSLYQYLDIPYTAIRTVDTTQWELRDALEPSAKSVYQLSTYDMKRLNDWINQASKVGSVNGNQNLLRQRIIMKVLRKWEGDNQRFGPTLTWKDVEATELDKLHSITHMCLLYKIENDRFEQDFSDDDEEDGEEEENSDNEVGEENSDGSDNMDQDSYGSQCSRCGKDFFD